MTSILRYMRPPPALVVACLVSLLAGSAAAQVPDSQAVEGLKRLSLEELMTLEITSVSKRPERLSEAASAIQVITGEDIRRSGATSLPEALRLAANLQVAQANSSQWAISARGFNNVLANKLLVLIDGRTVYTPLYAGVFWDVQDLPLESIDRIEVISGPGGALWGANAVNGVINIITKNAADTHGLAFGGAWGNELPGLAHVRYGGRLANNLDARVYGQAIGHGSTVDTTNRDARDSWYMANAGFRMDHSGTENHLTVQAHYYEGRPDPDGGAPVLARGGNLITRWSRTTSPNSDFQLQLYYDRSYRDFRSGFTEDLATWDADWQHRFQLGGRQEIVWGLGVRLMNHQTDNIEDLFEFLPSPRKLNLYSGFVQDEITLARDRLHLTVGTKVEHNEYTEWEVQPSIRMAWRPAPEHTLWWAVSRAVRTPSRIDRDFTLSIAPGIPFITGGDFKSEELLAYEVGWRLQPSSRFLAAISTFYNDYDNLRSAEPGPPPFNIPISIANGVEGHSYGLELAFGFQPTSQWQLRGGYTFVKKDLSVKPGSSDLNEGSVESNDPEHQFLIQSTAGLGRIELDAVLRYVDRLPSPEVASYFGLDMKLGWNVTPRLELAIGGQNLLESRHFEFIPSSPSPRQIERSIYGMVTWR